MRCNKFCKCPALCAPRTPPNLFRVRVKALLRPRPPVRVKALLRPRPPVRVKALLRPERPLPTGCMSYQSKQGTRPYVFVF
jgi:hypothetical protein